MVKWSNSKKTRVIPAGRRGEYPSQQPRKARSEIITKEQCERAKSMTAQIKRGYQYKVSIQFLFIYSYIGGGRESEINLPLVSYNSSGLGRLPEFKQTIAEIEEEIQRDAKSFVSHTQNPRFNDITFIQELVNKLESKRTTRAKHVKYQLERAQYCLNGQFDIDVYVMQKAHEKEVTSIKEKKQHEYYRFLRRNVEGQQYEDKCRDDFKQLSDSLNQTIRYLQSKNAQLQAEVSTLKTQKDLTDIPQIIGNLSMQSNPALYKLVNSLSVSSATTCRIQRTTVEQKQIKNKNAYFKLLIKLVALICNSSGQIPTNNKENEFQIKGWFIS
eukprot:403374641